MGRILAIDFGIKRTGIAITDTLQMIASGLTTVDTSTLLVFLEKYFTIEDVETIVIGEPKKLNNSSGDLEPFIQVFMHSFQSKFPEIGIQRIDERFTSKIAFQSMIDSGMKKKNRQNKALIDEISATIILQSYLNQIKQ